MNRKVRDSVQLAILHSAITHNWNEQRDRLRRRRIAFRVAVGVSIVACLMSLLVITGAI